MIKIAFFIAEIADKKACDMMKGAVKRAREKQVSLIICPGRYMVSAGHRETGLPDFYQETAVFDYISTENADALIMDIGEITKHASSKKREDFIHKFSVLPQVLINPNLKEREKQVSLQEIRTSEFYGTDADSVSHNQKNCREEITTSEEDDYEEIGIKAIDKAIELADSKFMVDGFRKVHTLSESGKSVDQIKQAARKEDSLSKKTPTIHTDNSYVKTGHDAILEESAHKLFHNNYQENSNPYDLILKRAAAFGARFGALYLFSEAVIYSRDNIWNIPDKMLMLSLLQETGNVRLEEAIPVSVEDIVDNAVNDINEPYICILNNLYLNDRQIGLMVTDFVQAFSEEYVNSLFMYMVTGAVRLIANEQQLALVQNALVENKKRIEKDASVLERLGDEDYLTKKLNRRGFFSQAYDKLSKNYVEGMYAVVAYIDMDSIKTINQHFGREEGDKAVKHVAELLEQVFGDECVLGRIRGNEFAVLLVTPDEMRVEMLREEMTKQNLRLMKDTTKPYFIHLQYSICSFKYREGLSLKDMLSETDDNLQKVHQI